MGRVLSSALESRGAFSPVMIFGNTNALCAVDFIGNNGMVYPTNKTHQGRKQYDIQGIHTGRNTVGIGGMWR